MLARLIACLVCKVAVWLSGNALALINVVALRRARLVLGWVTVHGYTILVFNQAIQAYSTWPSLLKYSVMSTGDGFGNRYGRNGEFCVTVGPITRTAGTGPVGLRRWPL